MGGSNLPVALSRWVSLICFISLISFHVSVLCCWKFCVKVYFPYALWDKLILYVAIIFVYYKQEEEKKNDEHLPTVVIDDDSSLSSADYDDEGSIIKSATAAGATGAMQATWTGIEIEREREISTLDIIIEMLTICTKEKGEVAYAVPRAKWCKLNEFGRLNDFLALYL